MTASRIKSTVYKPERSQEPVVTTYTEPAGFVSDGPQSGIVIDNDFHRGVVIIENEDGAQFTAQYKYIISPGGHRCLYQPETNVRFEAGQSDKSMAVNVTLVEKCELPVRERSKVDLWVQTDGHQSNGWLKRPCGCVISVKKTEFKPVPDTIQVGDVVEHATKFNGSKYVATEAVLNPEGEFIEAYRKWKPEEVQEKS